MQQPVCGAQPVPALMHHLARPDRPMRMHHRARNARCAGCIDDIGQAVGPAHVIGGRCQIAHRGKGGCVDHGQARILGAGDARIAQDAGGRKLRHHPGHLGRGQLGRRGYRHQTHGNRAKVGQREIHRIAQPHQQDVARRETRRQKPCTGAAHGSRQTGIGPVIGTIRRDDRQGHLCGQIVGMAQHMRRKVEGAGTGGGTAMIEYCKHAHLLGLRRASCKPNTTDLYRWA